MSTNTTHDVAFQRTTYLGLPVLAVLTSTLDTTTRLDGNSLADNVDLGGDLGELGSLALLHLGNLTEGVELATELPVALSALVDLRLVNALLLGLHLDVGVLGHVHHLVVTELGDLGELDKLLQVGLVRKLGKHGTLELALAATQLALAGDVATALADGVDFAKLGKVLLDLVLGVELVVVLAKALLSLSARVRCSWTYDIGGAVPHGRVGLERTDTADVLAVLGDGKEGVVTLSLGAVTDRVGDNGDTKLLELSHALEGEDGLDRDPSLGVASGEREEELVGREVRVGEVEVD